MIRIHWRHLPRFLLILTALGVPSQAASDEVHIALSMTTKAQREAYFDLVQRFELAHPPVKVHLRHLTSEHYKAEFPQLLADPRIDVLYWHAGQRLFEFVQQQQIAPLVPLWDAQQWQNVFDDSVIEAVRYNGQFFALPVSYYQLGFYYHRPTFERLGIQEPHTWAQFVALCKTLRKAGTTPVFIGAASNWPATAWFDYLNLRLNGLDYHQQVTEGAIPFTDPGIRKVLEHLKQLIDMGAFNADRLTLDWRDGLPLLYRGLVGMTMLGNYAVQEFPAEVVANIGFFPFPEIEPMQGHYEEAPLDVFVLSHSGAQNPYAKMFLAYLGSPQQQLVLNEQLGVIAPHKNAQRFNSDGLNVEAFQVLRQADGISQFFDRDASKAFADAIMPIFDAFMADADLTATLKQLETTRLQLLQQRTISAPEADNAQQNR